MTEKPQNKPQEKKLNQEMKFNHKKVVTGDNKNKLKATEKKEEIKEGKIEEKKVEDKKDEVKQVEVQPTPQKEAEEKKEEKKEDKTPQKKVSQKIIKKEEAVARGINVHASKKHCMYICKFIKNKEIDTAISELNDVIKMKRPIPFKGEIPHRHHLGMMSGRYPVNAAKEFIYLLKGLRGNVLVNSMDLDKTRIYYASATWDSRPAKRGGMRFKRAFIVLKAKEFPVEQEIKPKESKEKLKMQEHAV
ncbi:hypothetical protein HYW75_04610 [Candidatus Pacearchaeota archaeon]|nr:hypothetical protein [Candidatus Pacearchaeota archaeon]